MHLWHFNLIDFLAIDIELAGPAERMRFYEIEFQIGLPFRQWGRFQDVMQAVQKVLVVVQTVILDKHGVAAGHTADRHNYTFFIAT